jgi:DNA-binding MarR family transcriptional regulator
MGLSSDMDSLRNYIKEILGIGLLLERVSQVDLDRLPLYIKDSYRLYHIKLYDTPFVLAEIHDEDAFSSTQIEKHLGVIKNILHEKAVLLIKNITSINRKRLIEKSINFIVPGKQLFIPDILVDLREIFINRREKEQRDKLLPSAQFILLYHILHLPQRNKPQITDLSFKELAERLGYTPMAITNAVENLTSNGLCIVKGSKEKYISFNRDRIELWNIARPYLINPVLKQVYVDEKPDIFMLQSNTSALPEYSDMNFGNQSYYAIEKSKYYALQEKELFVNLNDYEGLCCLEVWKYDPVRLVEDSDSAGENVVDPLSLYLSMKDIHDERIEMALDQLIDNRIQW